MRYFVLLIGCVLALFTYVLGVNGLLSGVVVIMTAGFLFGIPFALGYLTVWALRPPTRLWSTFAPWGTLAVLVSILWLSGWEGTICIVMTIPLALPGATMGGLLAHDRMERARRAEFAAIVALPFLMMAFEARSEPVEKVDETVNSVMIAASLERVWDEITEVDSIRAGERSPALYTAIGFPAPVAATLDLPQEGGVRIASFERAVRFEETITEWEPHARLSFSIDPVETEGEQALDQHVRIGGPVFDVLEGTYELAAVGADSVRLTLRSRHRVGTRLNLYAGWWANLVMSSVQRNILAVIAHRAEDPARGARPRIRAATDARRLRLSRDPLDANSRPTGFSVTAEMRGFVDRYADSIVVLVRDGQLFARAENRPQRLDSITASLASSYGGSWNPGRPSPGLVVEWPAEDSLTRPLGPMRRFTIPVQRGDVLAGRWVVFSHHLTVPKTESNPYGIAWTYTHDERPVVRTP